MHSNVELHTLDQHFESLVSEVKITHRQFEEMLQRHASSSRSNKENQPVQPTHPVPLLNLQQVDGSFRLQQQRVPRSMIEAGMCYYKPKTTPKPFKLRTGDRAQIRRAAGGSPARVTPCPVEIKRPGSAGCSPAANQAVKGLRQCGFQFGQPSPAFP
jgi:hypothetical protein